jgi:hypothetical protein
VIESPSLSLDTFVYGLHTVAPYRVEEVSPDAVDVYVYDSEAPGEERIVHFERQGDGWQWTYTFVGSVRAAGRRTAGCVDMYPFPLEIGYKRGDPPIDFCQTPGKMLGDGMLREDASSREMLALVPAQGDVLIQDTLGRSIGWTGGTFVSEIPDAYQVPYALGDAAVLHHTLHLPAAEYTVSASGSSDEVELVFYVDGRFIELSAQPQSTGSVQLKIDSSLEHITLSGLQNLSTFALSMDNESAPESHLATIAGTPLPGSEKLAISFDGNQAEMACTNGGLQYSLGLENSGGQVFASEPLTLKAGEMHLLGPTKWTELDSGDVTLEIDQDSDGTTDETLELGDESSIASDGGGWVCPCPLAVIGFVGAALVSLKSLKPHRGHGSVKVLMLLYHIMSHFEQRCDSLKRMEVSDESQKV